MWRFMKYGKKPTKWMYNDYPDHLRLGFSLEWTKAMRGIRLEFLYFTFCIGWYCTKY